MLNSVGFWLTATGALLVNISLFIGEFARVGWLPYPPLSELAYSPGVGVDYYLWALQISGAGTLLSGVNLVTTVLKVRAPGMTYLRMPIFCWTTLASNLLIVAAFPILTATLAMLLLDRYLGFHFFTNEAGGNPMMFMNLIWAWGHPEVYILVLPAFGIFSEVFATFSGKPLFGYRSMVAATMAICILSFMVWLHHFFTMGAGADVNAIFGIATMIIAVPTGVKIYNWLFTMYSGRVVFATPMLWALGFVAHPRQPFGILVRAAQQHVGGLKPPLDIGLLGQHAHVLRDVQCPTAARDVPDDRRRVRCADDEQKRTGRRCVCSGERAHRVHDVEHAFGCLDLPHEQQDETVYGEVERAAQRGAVVGRAEARHVRPIPDRPVARRDPRRSGEPLPGGLGHADHPIGQALQDRVEAVSGGEPDEPDHPGRGAELGQPTSEGVAGCVGCDDVDGTFAQQGTDAAARPPDGAQRARLDVVQRDVHNRAVEGGEMIAQLARAWTDRQGLDHGTVEVLDQQRHAALPPHAQVPMMAHEGHANRARRAHSGTPDPGTWPSSRVHRRPAAAFSKAILWGKEARVLIMNAPPWSRRLVEKICALTEASCRSHAPPRTRWRSVPALLVRNLAAVRDEVRVAPGPGGGQKDPADPKVAQPEPEAGVNASRPGGPARGTGAVEVQDDHEDAGAQEQRAKYPSERTKDGVHWAGTQES